MSQMPVQINPFAPTPSANGGGSAAASAKGESGAFDRALQQVSTANGRTSPGGGGEPDRPGTGKDAHPGEHSGQPASGRPGGRQAQPGATADGEPRPGQDRGGQGSDIARELARLGLKEEQLEGKGGDRLLTMIQDLLSEGRAAGEGGGETGQTVLDLLARFREGDSEAALAQLLRTDKAGSESDQAARLAAILSGKTGEAAPGSGKAGGDYGPLSALSVGALPPFGSTGTPSAGLSGMRSQPGGGQGLDSLTYLLNGQLQGQGGAGGRGEGAKGQVPDGGSRGPGNRLAGSEVPGRDPTGREASARAESGMNGQGASSRLSSPSSATRVVQGQQTVPQAMVQVAKEASDGQRHVRLQLNPPNLGQVRVELQMTDQRIQAIFHVDSRQAASLLDGQLNTLRNALQEQQLDLEDAQVQLSNPDSGEGESHPWDQDGEGRRGPWTAWGQGDGAEESGSGATSSGPEIEGGLSLYA